MQIKCRNVTRGKCFSFFQQVRDQGMDYFVIDMREMDKPTSFGNLSENASLMKLSRLVRKINAIMHTERGVLVAIIFNRISLDQYKSLVGYANSCYCSVMHSEKFNGMYKELPLMYHPLRTTVSPYTVVMNLGEEYSSGFNDYVATGNDKIGSYSNMLRYNTLSYMINILEKEEVYVIGAHSIMYKYGFELGCLVRQFDIISNIREVNDEAVITRRDERPLLKDEWYFQDYVRPIDRLKLSAIFVCAIYNFDAIVYVGGYPGEYVIDNAKSIHELNKFVVLIDPQFPQSISLSPNLAIVNMEWNFSITYESNMIRARTLHSDWKGWESIINCQEDRLLLLDDTWRPGNMRSFLNEKLVFKDNNITRCNIWLKFNMYKELFESSHSHEYAGIGLNYFYKIMFFPFMNDSSESRIWFKSTSQCIVTYPYSYMVLARKYRAMSLSAKARNMCSFYVNHLTLRYDFMELPHFMDNWREDISNKGVIAMYSISNTLNASNSVQYLRRLKVVVDRLNLIGVPIFLTIPVRERVRVLNYQNRNSELLNLNDDDEILYGVDRQYSDYTLPMHEICFELMLHEFTDYMLVNLLFEEEHKHVGFRVVETDNLYDDDNYNQINQMQGLFTNIKIDNDMIVQSYETSNTFRLKAFTVICRNSFLLSVSRTYRIRANMALSIIHQSSIRRFEVREDLGALQCNVSGTYKFIPPWSSETPVCIHVSKGLVELSGHLLNLCTAAMFMRVPLTIWLKQMVANHIMYAPNTRRDKTVLKRCLLDIHRKKIAAFKILETDPNDWNKVWHTSEEMLITCLILPEYVTEVMVKMGYSDRYLINDELVALSRELFSFFFSV